jgi:hypothetical protein
MRAPRQPNALLEHASLLRAQARLPQRPGLTTHLANRAGSTDPLRWNTGCFTTRLKRAGVDITPARLLLSGGQHELNLWNQHIAARREFAGRTGGLPLPRDDTIQTMMRQGVEETLSPKRASRRSEGGPRCRRDDRRQGACPFRRRKPPTKREFCYIFARAEAAALPGMKASLCKATNSRSVIGGLPVTSAMILSSPAKIPF